ncbi:MAG: hypothetical protein JOY74_05965 [Sinobacteraceae bacterium]|nr:hypothetical protein [Nevskiaceae bacterium]
MNARHLLLLASIACSGATHAALTEQDAGAAKQRERAPAEPSAAQVVLAPLVVRTGEDPIPVRGGDGRDHLVYELDLANFTGEKVRADRLRVLDAGNGEVLADLDAAELAARLVVRDRAATPGEFAASQLGILYLHVVVDPRRHIPLALEHRLSMSFGGATVSVTAARLHLRPQTAVVLDAP